MNYLLLALSTTATSGKALLCKALGVGTYSERKTVLLHFRSLLIAACCF
jgi:hypothetical protein